MIMNYNRKPDQGSIIPFYFMVPNRYLEFDCNQVERMTKTATK